MVLEYLRLEIANLRPIILCKWYVPDRVLTCQSAGL